MAPWISQLRKGIVDLCILLVVEAEESYGYSLVRRLREIPDLSFTEGTVYPALARLIEEGLIQATQRPSPTGPPRRYLRLTGGGKRRLAEMRSYWAAVGRSVETLVQASGKGSGDEH